ncbi:ATP synthase subunit I [Candidatus Latescibacterota bacterium]
MYSIMDVKSIYPLSAFVRKIRIRVLVSGILLALVLKFLLSMSIALGFLAGVFVSLINFQLMAVDAYKIYEKVPKKARKFIIGRYAVRYAIMFGFLALIATFTDFNVFAAFLGLIFVQVNLVVEQLISWKKHSR